MPQSGLGCGRKRIPPLFDSGSQFTLICQSYFEGEIQPQIVPSSGEKAEAHQLFQLTAANNRKLLVFMYIELDLDFLGIMMSKVWIWVTKETNELLDECHKTKFPGVIGWNLINLAYQVFI